MFPQSPLLCSDESYWSIRITVQALGAFDMLSFNPNVAFGHRLLGKGIGRSSQDLVLFQCNDTLHRDVLRPLRRPHSASSQHYFSSTREGRILTRKQPPYLSAGPESDSTCSRKPRPLRSMSYNPCSETGTWTGPSPASAGRHGR